MVMDRGEGEGKVGIEDRRWVEGEEGGGMTGGSVDITGKE